jgi:hypothetical protein
MRIEIAEAKFLRKFLASRPVRHRRGACGLARGSRQWQGGGSGDNPERAFCTEEHPGITRPFDRGSAERKYKLAGLV